MTTGPWTSRHRRDRSRSPGHTRLRYSLESCRGLDCPLADLNRATGQCRSLLRDLTLDHRVFKSGEALHSAGVSC
jgi:hypothetical protein